MTDLRATHTPPAPLKLCVVSHTHWDREWYHPASRFRQRLVALIDSLIATPPYGHPSPTPFLLDGQAITLLDYLAVRPEREAALRERLRGGMLEAGPWFVLADNLIPSGEAILRNLEAGRRTLQRFGAISPPVAYCPDTFGHPAALPMIAAGYGFAVAIVWRGAGGTAHPSSDAFRWIAPDGSSVFVHHLPPDGYETGSALPVSPDAAQSSWQRLAPLMRARNHTGIALLPNGADHHALQPEIDAAMQALRTAAGSEADVTRTSLNAFASAFEHAASVADLPGVHGELRDSYGYTWTLGGTLGTRAHQKRRNAQLERALIRDVEPWLATAWLCGALRTSHSPSADARITGAQLPSLLQAAWQDLLETHPHDTLCGCSTDVVARAMDVRQDSVHAQTVGLRETALDMLLGRDGVKARARTARDGVVVVRNRSAAPRGGVAELEVIETLGDVIVGPGGADATPPSNTRTSEPHVVGLELQLLKSREQHLRRESPQHYPDDDLVRVHRALAWVPPTPACGLRVFGRRPPALDGDAIGVIPQVQLSQSADAITLSNGRVRVVVRSGTVSLQHTGPATSRVIDDLLSLESITDVGDSYTPSLRGSAEQLHCVGTHILHRGPLRASVRLRWETRARDVRIDTTLILDADAEHLRCDVRGRNRKRDHRVQLHVRTGLANARTFADAAFGAVERVIAVAPPSSREAVVPTMPMHRWVAQSVRTGDAKHGVTVLFSDGLAEAQSSPHSLSITLLRAIAELSRPDLPERPGHAGWPTPTPQSQCLGIFRARVAIAMIDAPSANGALRTISDIADRFLLPLVGHSVRDLDLAADHTSDVMGGAELVGDAFDLSATTLAVRHDGIVLRAVNRTSAVAQGAWRLPGTGPYMVRRCRLDETPTEQPREVGAYVEFEAQPREVITLVVTEVG